MTHSNFHKHCRSISVIDSDICARRSTSTMSSVDATGGEKKTSWPEVVGLPAEEAKKIILKDMPDADVVVLPAGSPVTMDWRSNRVRVFVDTVAQTPTVG